MDPAQIAIIVTGLAGILGGLAAFFKLRPERDSISVKVAEGALQVQVTLVDEMEAALNRVRADVIELRTQVEYQRHDNIKLRKEIAELSERLQAVTTERDRFARENSDLRARVTHLEKTVDTLSARKPEKGDKGETGRPGGHGDAGERGRVGDTGRTGDTGKTGPAGG